MGSANEQNIDSIWKYSRKVGSAIPKSKVKKKHSYLVYKKQKNIPEHIVGYETIKITEKDIKGRIQLKKKKRLLPKISPYLEGSEATATMYGE